MTTRDALEVDAVVVGAGPAGLAAAYRLKTLLAAAGRADAAVAVIEKGKEVGAHIISGAVLDPRAMDELIPDWRERDAPVESPVERDDLYFLTRRGKLRLPVVPPPLRNHGNYVISLNRFVRWLGGIVEAGGVDIFAGFAATDLIVEDGVVRGVRTGDKGVDRAGRPKGNYEPGIDLRAPLTILAEGARGSLTQSLIRDFELDRGRNPQVYAIGVKEVWEAASSPERPGRVIHTMGFPVPGGEFGGGFLYTMGQGLVSVGLVVGLHYRDPGLDPHHLFQEFKAHPFIRRFLAGGRMVSYGAKAIPEGGYWARPRSVVPGALIVGDAAGFLNSMRLKGIHLALKSGMLAAEAGVEALRAGDCGAERLDRFEELVEASWIRPELWRVRNFHQGFERGFWRGLAHAGLQMVSGGRGLRNRYPSQPGHRRMRRLDPIEAGRPAPPEPRYDGQLTFDKLTDVHHSGTAHEEDQPVHLLILDPAICHPRCTAEYGNPCRNFCPAAVYEMESAGETALRLRINASNCVHCKTCDIMDPYEVIRWVPPEGGGGPGYEYL